VELRRVEELDTGILLRAYDQGKLRVSQDEALDPVSRLHPLDNRQQAASGFRDEEPIHELAMSPDGREVVYIGDAGGRRQLYLRRMDGLESVPLPGTEGGYNPFFSPDGQSVAFGAGGKLRRVSVKGSEATVICDAPSLRGGSWSPDDTILFTPGVTTGLSRVPATGGTPTLVTTRDPAQAFIELRCYVNYVRAEVFSGR
jgi:Tol biopolymer transport system component